MTISSFSDYFPKVGLVLPALSTQFGSVLQAKLATSHLVFECLLNFSCNIMQLISVAYD